MAWVRIHDGALSHPKITGLIDLTNPFTLWVWGLTNCQMHLTDGLIVRDAIPKAALPAARNLVKRGLWEIHDVGWKVHNYLKWNDCRDLVVDRQTKAKDRKETWLAKQRLERAEKRVERVPNASGTLSEQRENGQPNLTKPNHIKKEQERVDDGFERFWAVYPRKVGKEPALKIWERMKPAAELQAQILAAVERQARSPQWTKDDGEFIPHAKTWLFQRRWTDVVASAPEPKSYEWDCPHEPRCPHRAACAVVSMRKTG